MIIITLDGRIFQMGTRQVFRFSDKFRGDISNSFA